VKRELAVAFVPVLLIGALSALALARDDARVPADECSGNRNAVDKPGALLSLVWFKQSRLARLIHLTFRVRLAPRERLIHKLIATFERARELTERSF
jgi:hypothetical protein